MGIVLTGNLILLALVVWLLFRIWKNPPEQRAVAALKAGILLELSGLLVAFLSFTVVYAVFYGHIDGFGIIQMLAWAIFLHGVLFLLGTARLLIQHNRRLAITALVLAGGIVLAGADALLIEPHWLEVTHRTISSSKIQKPLRIALLADIQTDAPGAYEADVLARVKAEQPDLILLAGDYVVFDHRQKNPPAVQRLRDILKETGFSAPLGIYAIQGSVEWNGSWEALFSGLNVKTISATTRLDLGPLVLTGLSFGDSLNPQLSLADEEKYHIVLGHVPNFSLNDPSADLLLAGHTHGGQVQLPLIGPLLTLSTVPRAWASGETTLAPEKTLIVSRGIGMERGNAPRLRFLCRPELVIIDLEPAAK